MSTSSVHSAVITRTSSSRLLDRLQQVAATHPAARRFSQARRQLLPGRERVVAVAGRWAHQQLSLAGADVETVLWCPSDHESPSDLVEAAEAVVTQADKAYVISPRTLGRLHPGLNAPTVLSLVRLPRWTASQVLRPDARLLLVADGIEYAGNLGTLVRSTDGCGADGLVLTSAAARLTHPKVFVASRGTVLTTPVLEYDDVSQARADLVAAGFASYVADPAAASPYRTIDYTRRPTAFVVGSEGAGVSVGWRGPDVQRVSIPMFGQADSLNVAASAAILLFEARAQLDAAN